MNQALLAYGITQEEEKPDIVRSFSFPMILSDKEVSFLHKVLDLGHEIREKVVAQRIENRKENRLLKRADPSCKPTYLKLTDQRKIIAAWLKTQPRFKLIHSQVAQNLCERIDSADKKWLKGIATGDKRAKPARHRERKDFRSITYPQYGNGVRLSGGKIWFSKLGTFRLHDYQKIVGDKKTVSIVWKQGRFWAVFTSRIAAAKWFSPQDRWQGKPTAGGDFGLKSLLTLSDGQVFDPPRRMKEAFRAVRLIQKSVSRKFEARKRVWEKDQALARASGLPTIPLRDYPRSNRLIADIRRLAKAHTKVERCRDYDQAKIASIINAEYSQIALEDHCVQFMIRNRRLAKSASDRAISKMKSRIKSTLATSRVFLVTTTDEDRRGNSQTCTCGQHVPKVLKDRVHACPSCGRTGDRDVVAADRVHLRTFGDVTQVRGQRVCERGEHKSCRAKRLSGELSEDDFRVLRETQTSQVSLMMEETADGKPTAEDKTSFALESKNPSGFSGSPLL